MKGRHAKRERGYLVLTAKNRVKSETRYYSRKKEGRSWTGALIFAHHAPASSEVAGDLTGTGVWFTVVVRLTCEVFRTLRTTAPAGNALVLVSQAGRVTVDFE